MNISNFISIPSYLNVIENIKFLFVTSHDKFNDSICFDNLLKNNDVEKAISLYSVKNELIDLISSVVYVARFCDLQNFKKYENFCENKINERKKDIFYQNALNWSVATDNHQTIAYLYKQKKLKAEWFDINLFKIAVNNNSFDMIDFFIEQVKIPLNSETKEFLLLKNPQIITQFESRIPFVNGDQSDLHLFIKNFKENKLFPIKTKQKLKISL